MTYLLVLTAAFLLLASAVLVKRWADPKFYRDLIDRPLRRASEASEAAFLAALVPLGLWLALGSMWVVLDGTTPKVWSYLVLAASTIALALGLLLFLFMWPQRLVPPPLRGRPGYLRWRLDQVRRRRPGA